MPSASSFLTDVGAWATPLFTDLIPLAVYAVGVLLAIGLVSWIVSVFAAIIGKVTGH